MGDERQWSAEDVELDWSDLNDDEQALELDGEALTFSVAGELLSA